MSEYNIQMNKYNALNAEYDQLYPATKIKNVDGLNIALQNKADLGEDGKVPESQLPSMGYSKPETLSDTTKTLFGLDATAVPDDVFLTLSGCLAQILVTTIPNTVITASLNGKTISATSDSSGLAVLIIPSYGTWTISTSIAGLAISVNYQINSIAQYELSLAPDLESTSWDDISAISESGNAMYVWNVGDKKTVNIYGTNQQVQIIGFNHDTKTSGGKAGITFQLVDCLSSTYIMNNSITNSGGWTSCVMRTSVMSAYLTRLPSTLQNVIKDVDKLTSAGSQSSVINTTSDKLFLLSEMEIFGSTKYSESGEGSQYDYYKAGNSKIKKVNGGVEYWWERSPVVSNSSSFCCVSSNGDASYNGSTNKYGVAFAFCV